MPSQHLEGSQSRDDGHTSRVLNNFGEFRIVICVDGIELIQSGLPLPIHTVMLESKVHLLFYCFSFKLYDCPCQLFHLQLDSVRASVRYLATY
ncbi:hypothetical protein A0H81_01925 [Grifola frondosa]|uniref:Uncharacterized protein n=1 Tax=Grifola frondosa TaxID=5627 RepID=A0A1C7MN82_GRIFR|nr:hypothetical protein A0H81_01925 [Grifola frondosa]